MQCIAFECSSCLKSRLFPGSAEGRCSGSSRERSFGEGAARECCGAVHQVPEVIGKF